MKKDNKIWWIIGIIVVGVLFYKYSGLFSMVQICGNDCKPYYTSFKGACSQQCGLTNSAGPKVTNCDAPKTIADFYSQYMPNVQVFADSKCTVPLSTYICTSNWKCDGFTSCSKSKNGVQTRNCRDLNNCAGATNKPEIWRSCTNNNLNSNTIIDNIPKGCLPNWGVGKWGKCINGFKERSVKDSNNCRTSDEMPPKIMKCGSSTFSIFEIFSTLPNPFIKYPNNKDDLLIVFNLVQKQRPLVGGLKLVMPLKGDWSVYCTLGAIIKYQGKDSILTAAHCVQEDNITLGPITYIQQGGETIGYPLISAEYNTSDSAIIYLNNGINGIIKDAIGNEISGFGEAKKGMKVYKIGARTGLTYGTIQDVNYVKDINKRDKYGNYYWYFAIKGDNGNFSDHGDSGSAIITVSSPHRIIGITSGVDNQSIAYSPMIQGVKNDLGIN